MFGHPAILNLPSSSLGTSLYTTVGNLVPHPLTACEWTLNLTDSKVSCAAFNIGSHFLPPPLLSSTLSLSPPPSPSSPLPSSQGLFCSRCPFQKGCRGCEIANASLSLDLKPGDHLSITFYQLRQESMKEVWFWCVVGVCGILTIQILFGVYRHQRSSPILHLDSGGSTKLRWMSV